MNEILVNMKRPPNLNEEIAALAKSDLGGTPSTMSMDNARARDEEKQTNAESKPNSSDSKRKRNKNRAPLVQTIRISVSINEHNKYAEKKSNQKNLSFNRISYTLFNINSHYPKK